MKRCTAAWLGVLLVAAALRLACLADAPPGVEHDEVAEVLIAQDIWRGQHALFFQQAYGQEPLFLYLAAGALALFGWNVLALRLVSAAVGLLTAAAAARLARRLFGPAAALVTAAGLGVMLWPVFWSRVGLRGMTLPLLMCLGLDALWRAISRSPASQPAARARYALLAGLFLGLAAYTYLAARGLPILLGLFVLYLWIVDRPRLRRRWRGLTGALALAAVIALPLFVYLARYPDLQYRVSEVNAPLTRLLQGDWRPVLENVPRVLGMFSVQGDSTVRNNFPDRPVFPEPLWAALFYVGLLVALHRLRDARYGLVLIWLAALLIPTLVTSEAPNLVRALGALPAVMMLPGIGARWVSDLDRKQSAARWPRLTYSVIGLALALNVWLTVRDYFIRWPQMAETQFVWQTDLAAVARALDADPSAADVTVAGLSNDSMDAPSLALLMRRDAARVRWVDTGSPLSAGGALVAPQWGGRLFVPSIVPLNPALADQLAAWGARRVERARFVEFEWPGSFSIEARGDAPIPFEANVNLLRVDAPASPVSPGRVLTVLSTWQAGAPPYPPLKIFVHVVDADGALRAQHDGLDSPAWSWQPGDVIVQAHPVPLPADLPPGDYALQVGLYHPVTLAPYHTLDGQAGLVVSTLLVR